jgi:hypothetical protein
MDGLSGGRGRQRFEGNFLFIMAVIVAAVIGALNYHLILFDDSVKLLKKTSLTLDQTVVDARGAKALKLLANPDLAAAGIRDLFDDHRSLRIPIGAPDAVKP